MGDNVPCAKEEMLFNEVEVKIEEYNLGNDHNIDGDA